jgi:SAM-dependent methyltransferase
VDKEWRFDGDSAREFTRVRIEVLRELVGDLRRFVELKSALDAGCAVGFFTRFLADLEFKVVGFDARPENVDEARKRNPGLEFFVADAEEVSSKEAGTFDFVLCVGLLYHLENPFRSIRNLFGLTRKILFLESLTVPGDRPELKLLDECQGEDQGVNHVAFYPTEACLIKLLYRSGFAFVYALKSPPDHPVLFDQATKRRERTMLVASKEALPSSKLELISEPSFRFGETSPQYRAGYSLAGRFKGLMRKLVSQA